MRQLLLPLIEALLRRAGRFRRTAEEQRLGRELAEARIHIAEMERDHTIVTSALRLDLQLAQDHVVRLEQQQEMHALLAEDMRKQIERNIAVAAREIVGT